MDLGGIAALIAALAFVVLVVGLMLSLLKLPKVIADFHATVKKLNTTIDVVTKDVDGLSLEVEALLNKTNSLMDDVNRKVEKIDPLFTAVGDLGETVSEVNDSAKNTATNLISGIGKKKPSTATKIVKGASKINKLRSFIKPSQKVAEVVVEEAVEVKEESPMSELERELKALANRKPSKTAGEITINKGVMNNEQE